MSPEVMSVVMLFAGLQGPADVLEARNALRSFEDQFAAAKTMTVQFQRKVHDAVDKSSTTATGRFQLRRNDGKTTWQIDMACDQDSTDRILIVWANPHQVYLFGKSKLIVVPQIPNSQLAEKERRMNSFEGIMDQLNMAGSSNRLELTKSDRWYFYYQMTPRECSAEVVTTRIALPRANSSGNKPSCPRRISYQVPNRDVVEIDFQSWLIDDPIDLTNLHISVPQAPDGWRKSTYWLDVFTGRIQLPIVPIEINEPK